LQFRYVTGVTRRAFRTGAIAQCLAVNIAHPPELLYSSELSPGLSSQRPKIRSKKELLADGTFAARHCAFAGVGKPD
jgi:hypothetical protein